MNNTGYFTERSIVDLLGRVIVTKYNISLLIITALWWICGSYLPYYNNNFDMHSTVSSYMMYVSILSIIVGLLRGDENCQHLVKLGVVSVILVVLTSSTIKAVYTAYFGRICLMPISMFCFLLLLKSLWLAANFKEAIQLENKSTGNDV